MHRTMKLFLFISARKVSSQRLPSQTVVNIGPAAGDPGPSTHPLSLVKVSDVVLAQQILTFGKPNRRSQTRKKVQKFGVRFQPAVFAPDPNAPLSCLFIGTGKSCAALCIANCCLCSKHKPGATGRFAAPVLCLKAEPLSAARRALA